MKCLIEVKNLSIGHDKVLQKEISFSLNEGEVLLIKGRNGSGKSTLIKTLCRELPALSGDFKWKINRKQISLLSQITSHQFPLAITLGEILDIFEPKKKVRKLLARNLVSCCYNDASGGERQKTLILTRLQKETTFLILDEPFNHLDKKAIAEMMHFINNLLIEKIIKGIILISHTDVDLPAENVKQVIFS